MVALCFMLLVEIIYTADESNTVLTATLEKSLWIMDGSTDFHKAPFLVLQL